MQGKVRLRLKYVKDLVEANTIAVYMNKFIQRNGREQRLWKIVICRDGLKGKPRHWLWLYFRKWHSHDSHLPRFIWFICRRWHWNSW